MRSIYKREVKSYFETMTGYIYLAIFFGISGYSFVVNNLLGQTNDVKEYFNNMIAAMMFLLPILTMRLLAEEKKLKTDQLLFTIPLSMFQILMGKFLAALTVFIIGIASTGIFVATLGFYGNIEVFTVIGCYLGIILSGACFTALGMLISSMTENQTIAAILTYAILFGCYLVDMLGEYLNSSFWSTVVSQIALFSRYTMFTMGVFDVSSAFYYLSLTAAFLCCTHLVMAKHTMK